MWVAGAITDLNTLIDAPEWMLEEAVAFNNAGWIVGTGLFNGEPHGFLHQPFLLIPRWSSRRRIIAAIIASPTCSTILHIARSTLRPSRREHGAA